MGFIADYICGDKCVGNLCRCGNETISVLYDDDPFYCCIPNNESCDEFNDNNIVTCQNGQKKSFENFCEDQGQCPTSRSGFVAFKSDCTSNHDCPASSYSSIC